MRIAVASDTHSNIYALEAVLKHMDSVGYDLSVHLGDSIGFGTRPSDTLYSIITNFDYICSGSHEKACVDGIDWSGLTEIAKESLYKTVSNLEQGELETFSYLEDMHKVRNMLFLHNGDSINPFGQDGGYIFTGKTHVPMLIEKGIPSGRLAFKNNDDGIGVYEKELPANSIINVGSVGMPLDGDTRACYAIFDTDTHTVTLYRIPYDTSKITNELYRKHPNPKLIDTFIHAR